MQFATFSGLDALNTQLRLQSATRVAKAAQRRALRLNHFETQCAEAARNSFRSATTLLRATAEECL